MPEEQYAFVNDGAVDLDQTFWKIKMKPAEVSELVNIMRDSTCFRVEGECGTYRDEMAFVFMKGEDVIKVIGIGCSQSYFSGSPEKWPSNKGSIQDPCDATRYNVLLEQLWKRIPEE